MRPLLTLYEDEKIWAINSQASTIFTITPSSTSKLDLSSNSSNSIHEKDTKLRYSETLGPQSYTFDHIYGPESTSQQIYFEVSRPTVLRVLNGLNGTIFMYGQTTSGKTFTMLGSPEYPGILPCSIREIFQAIAKDPENDFNVWVSYIEIYNEQVNDLLAPGKVNLKIKEDPKQGVTIQDVKQQQVWTFDQVILLMNYGEEHRTYRETSIHEHSSRSHTLFQVFIESRARGSKSRGRLRSSYLNLVDLAGSERLSEFDSKTLGQAGEAGYINRSLFVLAHVVSKLAEGKTRHIPYRDSKLTRILSQALGGNSLTSIVCTVSPAAMNYQQTLSTLRFATRAKTVHNVPHINETLGELSSSSEFKAQQGRLQRELLDLNTAKISYEAKCGFLQSQLESCEREVMMKEQEIEQVLEASLKEREVLERLKFLLEKQEIGFDKEKVKLNEEHRRMSELYQEERKIRLGLEKELARYKEAWARNAKTEQQTLTHLNKLIEKSGGSPVEILEDEVSCCADLGMGFVEALVFHIESEVCVKSESVGEWKDVSGKVVAEYKRSLEKLQGMYFNRVESLSESLIDDKRKVNEILDSHRGGDSRFKLF